MTSKKVTFDLMNLGCPVYSDPYEMERISTQPTPRAYFGGATLLPDDLLRQRLLTEAKNMLPDLLVKDPSSSDDSDDYEFPETMNEQVRRLSFAKRRRLHYSEFGTVALARRLVREEFASETSSMRSEDSTFLPEEEAQCPPCVVNSPESYPYVQYDRTTSLSEASDDSGPREDPEPGFEPTHPCFQKLMGQLDLPIESNAELTPAAIEAFTGVPNAVSNDPSPPVPAVSSFIAENASKITEAQFVTDFQESLERHTRVLDRGEKWDLSKLPGSLVTPVSPPSGSVKKNMPNTNIRSAELAKPTAGNRSI